VTGIWLGFLGKITYFFRVLSIGLRSAAYICQRVTNAVSYICDFHYGLQVINYLDDFAGCNTPDKASTEYDTRSGFEGVWSGRVGGKGYPSFYIYVFFKVY
jgi:hypothetical protein